jgi:hypothetical protein
MREFHLEQDGEEEEEGDDLLHGEREFEAAKKRKDELLRKRRELNAVDKRVRDEMGNIVPSEAGNEVNMLGLGLSGVTSLRASMVA